MKMALDVQLTMEELTFYGFCFFFFFSLLFSSVLARNLVSTRWQKQFNLAAKWWLKSLRSWALNVHNDITLRLRKLLPIFFFSTTFSQHFHIHIYVYVYNNNLPQSAILSSFWQVKHFNSHIYMIVYHAKLLSWPLYGRNKERQTIKCMNWSQPKRNNRMMYVYIWDKKQQNNNQNLSVD